MIKPVEELDGMAWQGQLALLENARALGASTTIESIYREDEAGNLVRIGCCLIVDFPNASPDLLSGLPHPSDDMRTACCGLDACTF